MTKSLTPQEAVIYLMVMVSASDRDMVDPELSRIGAIVRTLPAFRGFDQARTLAVAQECQKWLQRENGFEEILAAAAAAIPESAHETAYALAVDIAVADLQDAADTARAAEGRPGCHLGDRAGGESAAPHVLIPTI
jgi:tellurite resistance protein